MLAPLTITGLDFGPAFESGRAILQHGTEGFEGAPQLGPHGTGKREGQGTNTQPCFIRYLNK